MIFVRSEAFLRDFRLLPKEIQARVEKVLRLLAENPRHPSLWIKKREPKTRGIFEIRVTHGFRLTFSVAKNEIKLRRIGTHDILRTP